MRVMKRNEMLRPHIGMNHKRLWIYCFVLFAFMIFSVLPAFTETFKPIGEDNDKKTFSLYFENDTINQTDRHYTNGFKLTWLFGDTSSTTMKRGIARWLYSIGDFLPLIKSKDNIRDISFSFGQNIYTPENIEISELVEDDRPYAGISYFAVGFHGKKANRMDTIELYAGIVGPHSFAEDIQKKVHEISNSSNPNGWEHQLHDEPVLGVTYDRKMKLFRSAPYRAFSFDLNMNVGGGLGNAYTYLNCGSSLRFGVNMPNDFGTCRILPVSCSNPVFQEPQKGFLSHHKISLYFFLTIDGQGILRDIFLDGNTFRESHHIDKKPFVGDFMVGVTTIVKRFRISIADVYRTKMFKTQKDDQTYVTLNISYSY